MTLRTRLTLFFVVIVVAPLLAGSIILHGLLSRETNRRTETALQASAATAAALFETRVGRALAHARLAARDISSIHDTATLGRRVAGLRRESEMDFLVITSGRRVIAAAVRPLDLLVPAPSAAALVAARPPVPVARASVSVRGRGMSVHGGWVLDERFARWLAEAGGGEVAVLHAGTVVATTLPTPPRLPPDVRGDVDLPGGLRGTIVQSPARAPGTALLVARRPEGNLGALRNSMILLGLLGVLMAVGLGYALARLISLPLRQLSEGARAIAAGDFDQRVEVPGRDETAQLATSFNSMTENLRRTIGELRESRDELRTVLKRLGATLRSTTDIGEMFAVILESAAATLGARTGAIYRFEDGELRPHAAIGFDPESRALPLREGIAGHVAATGIPLLTPSRWTHPPRPAGIEPAADTAVAVPLSHADRTVGVLALYGRISPDPFSEEDLATLTSFAGQTGVAIENVLLREEAERLSVTDPLTGVGNRRHLEEVLAAEIERAHRFGRKFSILMIDLDHFKEVNDTYGHREGDRVLIEVCRRVSEVIRVPVDTLARYGGEEFVLVLPETPREGAGVVAARVLDAVRSEPFPVGTSHTRVTVTAGAAGFPDDGATADDLLSVADAALYAAKRAGRDCFRVGRPPAAADSAS